MNLSNVQYLRFLIRKISPSITKYMEYFQSNGVYRIHGPTAEEVTKNLDLTNKTCVITGGTSGIGLEMIRCLSARGCVVMMACRNEYAARHAKEVVCRPYSKNIEIHNINLLSLKSVKLCTEKIKKSHKKLDIVLLNAAVFGLPWNLTEDGLETTFQVNYISQMFFLMNIKEMLAKNARVVFVSASSHRNVNMVLPDPFSLTQDHLCLTEDHYTSIKAYNLSKLCGVLAMNYLNRDWYEDNISVYCAHPGTFVKTGLCRNWWPYEALYTLMLPFAKTISQAASTPLLCATSEAATGGGFWSQQRRATESALARDQRLARSLYTLTQDIIAERTACPAGPNRSLQYEHDMSSPNTTTHSNLNTNTLLHQTFASQN